jgi:carbonic anhydrase
MRKSFDKLIAGYQKFREKYTQSDSLIMDYLSHHGQKPEVMVVACSDSRVDPALILQCDPGDLFVVRNVANIVPPYEIDDAHHGTSAALEFGIKFLKVKHLILLGHSQCGGIQALMENDNKTQNDFISNWVSIVRPKNIENLNLDQCIKSSLNESFKNCQTFPWINQKIKNKELVIHLWYFDIKSGKIFTYSHEQDEYKELDILL